MAVGRHLEYIIPSKSQRFKQLINHPGPCLEGICLISRLYYEIYKFYEKNNNSKWLPDAILNIFVRAIAVDPGKYKPIKDSYMKVCAKFQLCKTIFKRNH